jgi:hypothetical protein
MPLDVDRGGAARPLVGGLDKRERLQIGGAGFVSSSKPRPNPTPEWLWPLAPPICRRFPTWEPKGRDDFRNRPKGPAHPKIIPELLFRDAPGMVFGPRPAIALVGIPTKVEDGDEFRKPPAPRQGYRLNDPDIRYSSLFGSGAYPRPRTSPRQPPPIQQDCPRDEFGRNRCLGLPAARDGASRGTEALPKVIPDTGMGEYPKLIP